MRAKEWAMFVLLGLIWGSSFLWIKVALGDGGFSPLLLVTCRVGFGLLGLAGVVMIRRTALPRDRATLASLAVVGLLNTAIPFILIAWAEMRIDSALASMLNGTVPLFTIVLSHVWLHDERITAPRLAGLTMGFVGIVVLLSRDLEAAGGADARLGGLAVLMAAVSYAAAAAYSRRYLRGQSPVAQSFVTLAFAEVVLLGLYLASDRSFAMPDDLLAWVAVAWLGLLGSCLALLIYFSLINAWGPTRASLVSYVFPVVGVVLGATILGEHVDWRLFVGMVLVVGGIAAVHARALVVRR